jgi:hypothetical protein
MRNSSPKCKRGRKNASLLIAESGPASVCPAGPVLEALFAPYDMDVDSVSYPDLADLISGASVALGGECGLASGVSSFCCCRGLC